MKKNTNFLPFVNSGNRFLTTMLRSFALGLFIMSVIFIGFVLLVAQELLYRAIIFGISSSVVCVLVLIQVSHNQLRTAGLVLVIFLWLMVSVGSYTGGGVSAPIFVGYLVVIFLSMLVFGNQGGVILTLLSVAVGGFLIYAEIQNILPVGVIYLPSVRLFIYTFFFVVVLFLNKAAIDATRNAISRASEDQYRALLENIPAITYVNDASINSSTTYVSPQVENLIGYSQQDFFLDPLLWTKIIIEEDRERVLAENSRTYHTLEPFEIEYRLITKSGKVIWVKDSASAVIDELGKLQCWLGIWTDITSIKEAESLQGSAFESLTRRTNQLQTASEVSQAATSILSLDELLPEVVELIRSHFEYYYVGLFLVDQEFKVLSLRAATGEIGNQLLQAEHSLEIGNTSMVGWCAQNNKARIALDVGLEAIRFKNLLLPLTRSEIALPLRARGRVIGAMTIQSEKESAFTDSDITALQTMCDQVANAIATASLFDERANLIKELESKNAELEQFAYTVSHDLKSPLVTMRGYLGYLKNSAVNGDFIRFDHDLERVINATNTMQDLLSDLLNLSRIGRIEEAIENVSVKNTVEKVLELVHNVYADKKMEIVVQENLPIVKVNPIRLREVIQNLIVNAMKFSAHQTTPKVVIGTDGFDSATKFPILFVKDNGVGIDPQYHKKIFGLFNRLDNEIEGTGVGLTLVKRIVEIYGGKIWVESDGHGNGSTFYFTLPPVSSP